MITHDRIFALLGVEPGFGADRSVALAEGGATGLLSSRDRASLIPPRRVCIPDLATLRELVTGTAEGAAAPEADWSAEEDAAAPEELGASTAAKLRGGLIAAALGQAPAGAFAEALGRHFFPMPATLFAARDLTVSAGQTWRIEPDGHDPVVCTFDTLTLQQGGTIEVGAPAIVNVTTFRKTA